MSKRDEFQVERLNGEALETLTFARGEFVSTSIGVGRIVGVSHRERRFRLEGTWLPFGFAYKTAQPVVNAPKRISLSRAVELSNARQGVTFTDADRVAT